MKKIILTEKKIRFIELILILGITILPSFLKSLFIYLKIYSDNSSENVIFLGQCINKAGFIALLLYVLFRQGRSIKEIGFSFVWKDISEGILLYIITAFVDCIIIIVYMKSTAWITGKPFKLIPQNMDFLKGKLTIIYILAILINPFFEELILRAYVMCEVEFLTNKKILPIIVSVIIQSSCHIYEGWFAVFVVSASFFILSLYFSKNKRVMPIIIAHGIMDITSMLAYAKF